MQMFREQGQGPVAVIHFPQYTADYRQLQQKAQEICPDFMPVGKNGEGSARITLARFRPTVGLDGVVLSALSQAEDRLRGLKLTIGGYGEFEERGAMYLDVLPYYLLQETYAELFEKLNGRINARRKPFIGHCTVGHLDKRLSFGKYKEARKALKKEFDGVRWTFQVEGIDVIPAPHQTRDQKPTRLAVSALTRLGFAATL